MSVVFAAVLRGAGDTPFLLRVSLYTAALPAMATWVGLAWLNLGLLWAWFVLTVWAWMLGLDPPGAASSRAGGKNCASWNQRLPELATAAQQQ